MKRTRRQRPEKRTWRHSRQRPALIDHVRLVCIVGLDRQLRPASSRTAAADQIQQSLKADDPGKPLGAIAHGALEPAAQLSFAEPDRVGQGGYRPVWALLHDRDRARDRAIDHRFGSGQMVGEYALKRRDALNGSPCSEYLLGHEPGGDAENRIDRKLAVAQLIGRLAEDGGGRAGSQSQAGERASRARSQIVESGGGTGDHDFALGTDEQIGTTVGHHAQRRRARPLPSAFHQQSKPLIGPKLLVHAITPFELVGMPMRIPGVVGVHT